MKSEIETARGLGWASLAIGLSEIFAPRPIEHAMGIGNGQQTGVLRVLGVRECMHGIDILSHRDPTPGIYARLAGDMLDGVLLAVAGKKTRRPGGFVGILAMVMGVVALDVLFAERLAQRR
jgi:hypothetical protein